MLKKPWIWAAWRSIVRIRSAPAAVSRSAISFAAIGTRGLSFLSCRAYPKYGSTAVIRDAEDRRNASSRIRSSIMESFTGVHVGCTTNTSAPRTFSSIWQ